MKAAVLILSLFASLLAQAAENKKPIKVVFGIFRPPYVFEKTAVGLDVDIAKAILEPKGYSLNIMHSPNQRAIAEIENKKVDGVIGLSPKSQGEICYTDPFIYYDNVAVSKTKKNLKIKEVGDLKKYNFLSFQKAEEYLGPEYKRLLKELKKNTDISNQLNQNRLFWSDKVDIIILDLNVFRHYQKQLKDEFNTQEDVVIHRIFNINANPRVGAFVDKKVCDDFNKGLKEIKANGEYQKILDKYLKPDQVLGGDFSGVIFLTSWKHKAKDRSIVLTGED